MCLEGLIHGETNNLFIPQLLFGLANINDIINSASHPPLFFYITSRHYKYFKCKSIPAMYLLYFSSFLEEE